MSPRLLSALTLTLAGALPAQIPVVGHWKLDETMGFTAQDAGPRGNHGTLVNFAATSTAHWVPGVFGNALDFDGVDDYVDLPVGNGLPFYSGRGATFSVCMWVRGAPTDDDRVLSLGHSTSTNPLFTLGTGSTSGGTAQRLRVYVRNEAGTSFARYSDGVVFDNTWHHLVYTETSGQAAVFIDGVRDTASFDDRFNARGTRSPGHGTYRMDRASLGGVLRGSACCFFRGALDDVRVYGYALDQADVATVMAGGTPTVCRPSIGEYGVPCGPGPLDLYAAGTPAIGGSGILFSMRGGTPGAVTLLLLGLGQAAPVSLGARYPGCTLYSPSLTYLVTGVLSSFGSNQGTVLPIPAAPALACNSVVFQGAAASSTSVEFSNAIIAMLGF